MKLTWLGFGLLASVAAAAPSSRSPKVKHSVREPRGWTKYSVPSPSHRIELRIGLAQPNIGLLESHLLEISDPKHPRYGQHLSKQEVEALAAPHDESLGLVNEWLASHGIGEEDLSYSPASDWVIVSVPLSLAESMLDTTYHVWKHTDGDYLVRTTSYSLPEHLHAHVDLIQPTTMFARWKGMKSTIYHPDSEPVEASIVTESKLAAVSASDSEVDPACNTSITISCLKQLYNVGDFVPTAENNSIGITAYLEQFANLEDLKSFYEDQLPEAVNTTFEFVSVKGGINDQNISLAGVEANLDVQFAFGLAFPIPGTFWSTAGRPPFIPDAGQTENTNEPYNDWLDFILAQDEVPYVISTSYGESEQTVPEEYARRACTGFAQLGARGVTLTFSSGDGGVGDGDDNPETTTCITNDGQNITRFQPLFPSSCPYVTSVGGTNNVPEIAVFFSGGGFSDYFPRPSYQDAVVSEYLNNLAPGTYEGLFNKSGRAAPDVAAQGRRFRVWASGEAISVGGTSASSPTFAGIVALLNDARLSAGLPSLGFINPLLYTPGVSEAFNDIDIGNNPGCGTEGFNATTGWDPVTGFGTPNFQKLKDIVLAAGYY